MKRSSVSRTLLVSIFVAGGVLGSAQPALAAGPDVLILGSEQAYFLADVQAKVRSTGMFSAVDVFNAMNATPSLATLQAYRAALVFTSYTPADRVALGNVLADYIDWGGRVVLATFSSYGPAYDIRGRLASGGYLPFTTGSYLSGPATLSPVIPGHYLLAGVASFYGGASSYRTSVGVTAGTTLVAGWSDGLPLVAILPHAGGGDVIGLNFYPPSSSVSYGNWDTATDGARLMANALSLPPLVGGDSTPPVVTGSVTPAAGVSGWYTGTPVVSWSVSDAESGIASAPGCQTQTITTQGAGLVLTCTATNRVGMSTSSSLTISFDGAAPSISAALSSPPNARGWHNDPVTVSFTCTDAISGVASCSPSVAVGEGVDQSVVGSSDDVAGNTRSLTVSNIDIDLTPPTTIVTSPPLVVRAVNQRIYGFAADSLSGVDTITVTLTDPVGATFVVPATCSSGCGVGSVAWSAIVPAAVPSGVYSVAAASEDIADNVGTSPPSNVLIV